MRSYKYEWDEENHTFGKKPLHDWSSHAADAMRYLSMRLDQIAMRANFSRPLKYPKMGKI